MWTVSRADRDAGRFAELYAWALDRLGDPRPHQRMGALHTFESLADWYPQHAQAIVDVLCAYLRSPVEQDGAIRDVPQRMLTAHLRPGWKFWPDIDLDLTGAALVDLDLSDCRLRRLILDGAVLTGPTRMRRLTAATATLRNVQFRSDVWLEHSSFAGAARFEGATFDGDAWFGGARFGGPTSFAVATVHGHAWFSQCVFGGPVEFGEAVFHRSAGFRGAVVNDALGLAGTTFLGPARVSRSGEFWNVDAPGWGVVVDADNEAVGHLLWLGAAG
jgi:uncharacterized protein YjbI with pentapeptide repeats